MNNPEEQKKYEVINSKDLSLINDLNAALQHEKHRGLFWSIILLFVFLVVFVIWAYNSSIQEITRGQGTIIPSSREQVIQSLDPGIVKEIMVREGSSVKKGQVLIKLDDTRTLGILRESEAKVNNLEAMLARLKSEAYGVPLTFPSNISEELRKRETAAYIARKKALQDGLSGLRQSKALLDREISITTPMVKAGVVSQVDLLRMQRQSSDLGLQIAERANKYSADANDQLIRVESDLAQAKENMAVHADPVERSLIRAPVNGIVKNVHINTIGGVIGAGQDIMEIIPLGEKLLVQAYIRPRDVAFIHPGQTAIVKLSAYDYAIYGGLEGKVTFISPDTLRDQKHPGDLELNPNQSYYRVIIQTDKNTLTDKTGKPLPIIPGMVTTVDIKTGEKTVFQYLIKPITRLKQALQER